jgi:hypothetical protein
VAAIVWLTRPKRLFMKVCLMSLGISAFAGWLRSLSKLGSNFCKLTLQDTYVRGWSVSGERNDRELLRLGID